MIVTKGEKTMKNKSIILLITIIVLVTVLSACSKSNTTDSASLDEGKTITATTAGVHYPWNYKEDGKLLGYDVEVTEAVAAELGYQVNWVTADFAGQLTQLESGRTDVVAEHTAITDKRKEKYDFTTPYAYPVVELMVKEDSALKTLDDLKGKSVAVALGSFYEDFIRENNPDGSIKVVTYEDTGGILNDVDFGRVDAYLNDKISGLEKIKKAGLPLKMNGETILKAEFSYPFPKTEKGKQLRDEFEKALQTLRENGKLKEISLKYFNEDITVK